jgi:hypothetical protein
MTSSGTTAASFFYVSTSPSSTPTAPDPGDDQSQSFHDVMQQQSEDTAPAPSNNSSTRTPSSGNTSNADTSNSDDSTDTTANSDGSDSAPTKPVTRSMTIVAPATIRNGRSNRRDTVSLTTTVLAAATGQGTNTAPSAASGANSKSGTTKSTTTASTPGNAGSSATTTTSDMSTMMIQAMLHASQLQSTQNMPAVSAITQPSSRSANADTPAAATSANSSLVATTTPATVSSLAAQALAAATAASTATSQAKVTTGTETPLSGLAKASTANGTKEKKSASGSSEGSFLQAGNTAGTGISTTSNLTATAVTAVDNSSQNQQFTSQSGSSKNAANSLGVSGAAGIGTNRDDKSSTMNTDLNLSDMLASTNSAANTPPEVNILLSSNNDFEDALKQVIHIAQLNDATGSSSSTVNPTRIAIELQTPPGAIVNVYVSKVDDTYRAQLSTSDPAALSWVQDKIASLRSNDLGVEVKWLPAQVESSSSISATTTSSDSSNLNWNRDGQQQNNPSSDDRDQYQRQNQSSYEDDLVEDGADSFTSSLATAGGVA